MSRPPVSPACVAWAALASCLQQQVCCQAGLFHQSPHENCWPRLRCAADPELAGDWRSRLAVAQKLAAVAELVTSAQAAYCLWPLLLTLIRDPVSAVRVAAAGQAGPLLAQLPEDQLPAECSDAQKAAAAAAALRSAQDEQQADSSSASAGAAAASGEGAAAAEGASEAAEHILAAVVATHAVSTSSSSSTGNSGLPEDAASQPAQAQEQQQQQEEQQQQQQAEGGPGQRLRWVRRGLTSGLYQLQQQVRLQAIG